MTPREQAQAIIQSVIDEFGEEVFISESYAAGYKLQTVLTEALTPATPVFAYNSNVSDEEFETAMSAMVQAIAVKDTPEEWAKFTGQTLLVVGKLAVSYFGFGPAVSLVESIFGTDHELVALVKLIGEKYESTE